MAAASGVLVLLSVATTRADGGADDVVEEAAAPPPACEASWSTDATGRVLPSLEVVDRTGVAAVVTFDVTVQAPGCRTRWVEGPLALTAGTALLDIGVGPELIVGCTGSPVLSVTAQEESAQFNDVCWTAPPPVVVGPDLGLSPRNAAFALAAGLIPPAAATDGDLVIAGGGQ